ncbi:MAG: hypothetical protein AB7I59_16070 [Geminicoccaceae bacterium]
MLKDTDLIYNVVEELLTGEIDGKRINAHSVSGGRAGSKQAGAVNLFLANNPFSTAVRKTASNPGGAIPLARFLLQTHETRPNWIRLVPMANENLHGRSGFAIHGRGQRGSDGCIVPSDFHNVLLIHSLVRQREATGRPAPTLQVVAIGELSRFENLMRTA